MITIIVILIVTSISIYTAQNRFSVNNLSKMYNDIDLLSDKVSNYYLKYSALPVVRDGSNKETVYSYTNLNFNKNANDNDTYYILDLSALEEISLNYGKEGFQKPNESDDVYIINEASHIIYYVKGIENKGTVYHTVPENAGLLNDNIPPAKPQINIVSGRKNSSGVYNSEVEVEIVPGKDNWSGAARTTYTINDEEETELTADNSIVKITEDGTYSIHAVTYDTTGNVSEKSTKTVIVKIPKIGDKVAYNELEKGIQTHAVSYTENGGTSEANNQAFQTEDLEWRLLAIDDDGTIELISHKPTKDTLYLRGENGYLNAIKILNETCDALYGKGEYAVSSRSLTVDDINKISKFDPTNYRGYGTEGQWRVSSESQYAQYSQDGGKTWTDTLSKYYTTYKVPGRTALTQSNYGVEKVVNTSYGYNISDYISDTKVVNLIKNGEESSVGISQWLASTFILNDTSCTSFGVRVVSGKDEYKEIGIFRLIFSDPDAIREQSNAMRPVVTLQKNVELVDNNNDGTWEISFQ